MAPTAWWTYAATVLLLVSVPGPSQLLMVSNSVANGPRRAAATLAGDLSANLLQMLAAGAGLGALILRSEPTFLLVKWCGVAYLAILGVGRIARAGRHAVGAARTRRPLRALWWDGFVTSAANPKAVLFFAALFPQFIRADGRWWAQVAVLGVTYLALDGACLALYGLASRRLTRAAGTGPCPTVDRVAGGLILGASLLLGGKTLARAS